MTFSKPMTLAVPDDVLTDLRDRLARTRWPDEPADAGWNYGVNAAYLRELVGHWHSRFSWREQEARLNAWPHFQADIDGFTIHFMVIRGKGPKPLPLIATHGWPSSFLEFGKLIPLLTDPASVGADPAQSFDLVIPSLPGFGFSPAPRTPGCTVPKIAELWHGLMTKVLGYERFCAHGSDWGASVTARLGFAFPAQVMGIHTTCVTGGAPARPYPGDRPASAAELAMFEQRARWRQREGAYAHAYSTKPQTAGYALNDSPVGLAAELVDRLRAWSDCGGDVETRFTKDELLTLVTLYWVTQSIASSLRIYLEDTTSPWDLGPNERITVPCGVAHFHQEPSAPLREWGERFYNIQSWSTFDRGGHFPAYEEPELLAADLRAFFSSLGAPC